mgnify:CR=1 FL=1
MSYATETSVLNAQWNAALEASISAHKAGLPHVLMRPTLSIDGNTWCALYGDNLRDGVAGFGGSPEEAMADFDKNWVNVKTPPECPKCGEELRLGEWCSDHGRFVQTND